MSITTPIRGLPVPEHLVGSTIHVLAPGYTGQVKRLNLAVAGARATGDPLPLAAAASATDTQVIEVLSIDLAPVRATAGAATARSAHSIEPQLHVLQREGTDYALLQTDEQGVTRWVLPQRTSPIIQPASGDSVVVFALPAGTASTSTGRGVVTSVMRRVVRIVAWAAAPLLGRGALASAQHWEQAKRPHALKRVSSDGEYVGAELSGLSRQPTLLLIHGTFSTPQAGFHGWVGTPGFTNIVRRYGDRCYAFAHPTLSASPDGNVRWLVDRLAGQVAGPIDIVCHSRGGLVARELAASEQVAVRRVCQVGTPNSGTPLAHAKHIVAFLDGHTALLTALPDSVSTIVLEGCLCVIKLLVTGAGVGLPGLSAMQPGGNYLSQLNARRLRASQWFTIGANFQPGEDRASPFARRFGDAVIDRFFGDANDLVVPSKGCHEPGPAPADGLRIDGAQVHHTNYFLSSDVHASLDRWMCA